MSLNNFLLIPLSQTFRGQYRILFWMAQGSDQVQEYKDCLNCLFPDPSMVGVEKNIWFLGTLRLHFTAYFDWKDLKRHKNCFLQNLSYYIYFRTSELGAEIKVTNITFRYKNLPEIPPGFLYTHPFPNTLKLRIKECWVFMAFYIIYHHFKYQYISLPLKQKYLSF